MTPRASDTGGAVAAQGSDPRVHVSDLLGSDADGSGHGRLRWRKSSASTPNGNCVELAALPDRRVGIRHSRDPFGPVLIVTGDALAALLTAIRAGVLDDLVADRIGEAPIRSAST